MGDIVALMIQDAFSNIVDAVTAGIPNLVYALIILAVGYVAGKIVGILIEKIVVRTRVDTHLREKNQLTFKLSSVLATISKWIVYLVFLQQAALQLGVAAISDVISQIVAFIPGVVGAVLVIIASYAVAIYIKEEIVGSNGIYVNIMGKLIFFFVIYVGIATALPLMRIDTELINNILLIIMASIGAGVAIAIGLGLRDAVADIARGYVEQGKRKRE